MSDLDSRLINSIILGGRGEVISEQGLIPEMFESDARGVFLQVMSHFRQHAKLPGKVEILRHFRNFHFIKPTEPLPYYVAEINRRFKMVQFRATVSEALSEVEKTEDSKIGEVLQGMVSKFTMALNCGVTSAADYSDRISEIHVELERKRNMPAEFSFGMDALDKDLIGMNRGDLTLIGGLPGQGKSWVLLQMAYNNWAAHNRKVLVVSLEMSASIIKDRLDAIACKFDYDKYRRGQLNLQEESLLISNLQDMKQRDREFKIISFENYDSKAKAALGSVESIGACIQRYKPDVLYVDGIYLGMSMKWEDATKFANDFHTMLENCRTPCIATTQMKQDADENKPRLQDLAFTAGFMHACSYAFLMGRDKDAIDRSARTLTVAKAREACDRQKYMLEFQPASKIELTAMTLDEKRDWWDDTPADDELAAAQYEAEEGS